MSRGEVVSKYVAVFPSDGETVLETNGNVKKGRDSGSQTDSKTRTNGRICC